MKRQHRHACEGRQNELENAKREPGQPMKWNVEPFPLYTLRHTCLTRWAPHMDPWTLAYLAGHRDMSITKRYTIRKNRTPELRSKGREQHWVGAVLGTLQIIVCRAILRIGP